MVTSMNIYHPCRRSVALGCLTRRKCIGEIRIHKREICIRASTMFYCQSNWSTAANAVNNVQSPQNSCSRKMKVLSSFLNPREVEGRPRCRISPQHSWQSSRKYSTWECQAAIGDWLLSLRFQLRLESSSAAIDSLTRRQNLRGGIHGFAIPV